jgi:hypothetical protein
VDSVLWEVCHERDCLDDCRASVRQVGDPANPRTTQKSPQLAATHDKDRWCLWLVTMDARDAQRSPVLRGRIAAVCHHRASSKSPTTSTKDHPPHLFGQIAQPSTSYLAIPRHVSEHRQFYPAARSEADVICGDANFLIPDPDGFALGILSSSMFMSWQRAIGGRIGSRLRFSRRNLSTCWVCV